MKTKSWICLGTALGVVLVVSGCWLFGITLVLTYDIEDEIVSTESSFNSVMVDLTEEDDWKDNQDKLDEIHHLYFYGWVTNNRTTPATGQLYMYEDTSLHTIAAVESQATLVLDGLVFPANSTADSTVEVPLIAVDLQPVRDLVMEGKFGLYAIAEEDEFDIRVFDASVIVVFAVEP